MWSACKLTIANVCQILFYTYSFQCTYIPALSFHELTFASLLIFLSHFLISMFITVNYPLSTRIAQHISATTHEFSPLSADPVFLTIFTFGHGVESLLACFCVWKVVAYY